MRIECTAVHSSVPTYWALWLVLKIYHDFRRLNRRSLLSQILIYLDSRWIATARGVRSFFGQRMCWMLFCCIQKLLSTHLLRKLSIIIWAYLRPINKESIISHRRLSSSNLIVYFNIKLVKLLNLLIFLLRLRLRWNLLFVNKLLLLFWRNHVPILLAYHLMTLNPVVLLLASSSLSEFTKFSHLLRIDSRPMKTFSNESVHWRRALRVTRVSLFIINDRASASIE